MIKLAIVDDHSLLRESLAALIDTLPGINVILQAGNGCEFLKKLRHTYIDIVLLDLQMPVLDGFETCEILHKEYPDLKILALSQFTDPENIKKILHLGAHGYATKNLGVNALEKAILKLHHEGFFFEKNFENIIYESQEDTGTGEETITISEREREIILYTAKGMNGREVADFLNISLRTVEVHKRNLMDRLGCKNFIGVLMYAISYKIVLPSDIYAKNT